ncbi:MAG TPA: hypothetical protein VND22_02670 [Actinomycetota bacterium]|nr:hypothetical protein [Actinomycetota bacterium]
MRKAAAVLVSVFLFVGLFILPAAAHHRDGHENGPPATAGENGGGGDAGGGQENGSGGDTQGNAGSNPDGGGVDKPYDAAGQPAQSQGPSYYDGNNGCGQDKKVEAREGWFGQAHNGWDDNNGWCGKPVSREPESTDATGTPAGAPVEIIEATPVSLVIASGSAATFEPSVETVTSSGRAGTVLGTRFSRVAALSSSGPIETQVMGIKLVRGQPLAMTGISMASYLLIAAVLGLIGALAMFVGRKSAVRI